MLLLKLNKKLTVEPILSLNEILRYCIQTDLLENKKFTSESLQGKALKILILATEQFLDLRIKKISS